jgi:hypothetical protein
MCAAGMLKQRHIIRELKEFLENTSVIKRWIKAEGKLSAQTGIRTSSDSGIA